MHCTFPVVPLVMDNMFEKVCPLHPLALHAIDLFGAELAKDPIAPFCFLMDASMLGVGVGFDTKGAGTINVVAPGSAGYVHREDPQVRTVVGARFAVRPNFHLGV